MAIQLGRRTAVLATAALIGGMRPAAAEPPARIIIGTGVDPSFSAYYVAKEAGIFARNGLDVQLNTGPSGSAMVALVIQNQAQSAFGSEVSGILDHALDPNVVAIAEGSVLEHWFGLVARNIDTVDGLKGKRIGVARGTGSELFWFSLVAKRALDPKEYKIVQVDAPEMVAALERGDIDAYIVWEPWVTRGTASVANAKVLLDNEGLLESRVFIYVNKGWALKNPQPALAFLRSLIEATDRIHKEPDAAAAEVGHFLRLEPAFVRSLMNKLTFAIRLDNGSIEAFQKAATQLKNIGKLPRPIDWQGLIYPDLLKQLDPNAVSYTLPQG